MVLALSPPVPAVSNTPSPVIGNGRAAVRKACAAPAISATVSPRVRIVASNAAICTSSYVPIVNGVNTARASSTVGAGLSK